MIRQRLTEIDTTKQYMDRFKSWNDKSQNGNQTRNFAKAPNEFLEYLGILKPGAIRLYLYYLLRAKNGTGECWPTIDTISKDLNVSARTIEKDNKELIDYGLIARVMTRGKNKTTILIPIGLQVRTFKTFSKMKAFLMQDNIFEIYGTPVKLYHLVFNSEDDTHQIHKIMIELEKSNKSSNKVVFMSDITMNFHMFKLLPEDANEDLCIFNPNKHLLSTLHLSYNFDSIIGIVFNASFENIFDYDLAKQIIGCDFDSYPTTSIN